MPKKDDKPKTETTITREVKQETGTKPDPNGDIDERMAALLQDHKRMGAR